MKIKHHLTKLPRILLFAVVLAAVLGIHVPAALSQARQVSLGVKYLNVADIQSSFCLEGGEFEMHRTGSGLGIDQIDGLRWPAQYRYQDTWVAKSMWIGTTNFFDPVIKTTFPYKVVCAGPRFAFPQTEIMNTRFKLIGRFLAPEVLVDEVVASTITQNDALDSLDANMLPDRMIDQTLHTSIGVTVTRRLMSFTQQNHSNYFIYEYKLKNTGIIDLKGTKIDPPDTLTGVILHFQYRLALANEAFRRGWGVNGQVSWGRNTVNETVGTDPAADGFEFRGQYSWYGPHSSSATQGFNDWGAPDWQLSGTMSAARLVGVVALHADKSASDKSDDPTQPRNTRFIGSDNGPQAVNQYNSELMTQKYVDYMSSGHPSKTQGELVGNTVGDSYADLYGDDPGGYSSGQGFGPYDLAPGDSITVVIAEGVAGLCREKNLEVGKNWFQHWQQTSSEPMVMPDGSTTADFDAYKYAWVWTAKDSLFKMYRNAIANYNSGYQIPQPPPPPEQFVVRSGGDRIFLSWADNARSWPYFDGYRVYRAVGKPDTMYQMIFESDASNPALSFEDTTAQRGINHFYYVVSKDDGSQNDLYDGVPLESGKFYTMTASAAFLRRQAEESLDSIVVVPNPYNINATNIQFGVDQADQISFFNLPPQCTIRIFTERGDLVKTIHHTNASGDESWDSTTEYKQLVVSGLYIAHFEVTEDVVDKVTNEVVLRKGKKTFRKFIIIR